MLQFLVVIPETLLISYLALLLLLRVHLVLKHG